MNRFKLSSKVRLQTLLRALMKGAGMACAIALMTPVSAFADASARAYLGDSRLSGQVQPPFIHGSTSATSLAGTENDAGYAYAFADMTAGILRVVGKSVYPPPGVITTSDASAGFSDTITISGGNGLMAYLDYSFDGTLAVAGMEYASAFAQMAVNVSTVATGYSVNEALTAYQNSCGTGTNCAVGTSTARTGSLAFPIFANAPTSFAFGLSGTSSLGNAFDFGNTAKFYLRLPEGVTYTSSSGSFLAAASPISMVPEPQTLCLFLAGLALLSRRLNSHRRGAARAT